ncbi:hypothetical protein G6321_00002005 (plasmid) [Bradyrhizobium barranii subsp. barranii]|uniref:Uncharacterized protein n=1 Tax=Bradyrhizobium barranii subsp. barranii TaxID=2823807 RepID=A0A7Z0QLB9_9BRAD|nr:hypothetical protein [Bradyrhizobium barranii]UGX89557.1 hypothetical protein G6321_00002005 [Bradyrhizobium barranii subsp. barranii]
MVFIDGFEQPLRLLEDSDQAAQLFHAFHEQFNFIRLSFRPPWPPEQTVDVSVDQSRYASLLRWLIDGMRTWNAASDTKLARLTAMIVVAQVCDSGNALWNLLPDDIGANSNLVNQLTRVAASIDLTIVSAGGQPPPIREAEIVEASKADAKGDWANIMGGWRRFPPIFPSTLQTQTMRFLLRYARPQLLACLNKIQKTPLAFVLVQVFTPEQCLRLALESESPRFQFAAVYRSFTDQWRSHRAPTSGEAALLTALFIEVSKDPSCWDGWMLTLAQQPELQEALGKALVQVPDTALRGYVDAIRLWSRSVQPNPTRQSITSCLRAFCAEASLERRSLLWGMAYQRWCAWRFSDDGWRTAIQRSDLDSLDRMVPWDQVELGPGYRTDVLVKAGAPGTYFLRAKPLPLLASFKSLRSAARLSAVRNQDETPQDIIARFPRRIDVSPGDLIARIVVEGDPLEMKLPTPDQMKKAVPEFKPISDTEIKLPPEEVLFNMRGRRCDSNTGLCAPPNCLPGTPDCEQRFLAGSRGDQVFMPDTGRTFQLTRLIRERAPERLASVV